MKKMKIISWITVAVIFLLCGCREEFDDHYNSVNDAMGLNVTQLLESKGDFSLFVKMIRRANLERTLNESGLYTCLAPRDEHIQSYLDKNGWTIETMPERKLLEYINYHFIVDRYFLYDFEHKYYRFENDWRHALSYSQQVTFPTRGDKYNRSKFIRIFTRPYLEAREYDYIAYTGREGGDFMIENVRVSETDRDFPMLNGVLHVLDAPLDPAPRADEAMAKENDLTILMSWLDLFHGYESRPMDDQGNIDTTKIKYYHISTGITSWGAAKASDIANDEIPFTIIAPTDQAIRSKLDAYMNPEQLVEYDSIPKPLLISMLRGLIATGYEKSSGSLFWGIGDIARNNPYFYSDNNTILPIANDITAMNPKGVLSSNAVVYKVDVMPELPMLQSVEAGLYINFRRYRQWQKMIENNHLYISATDLSTYQHPPKTILIQPDNSESAWTNPANGKYGTDAWDANYQDTLGMRLRAGVLDYKVADGQFEHRYYPGPYGYILFEDGYFFDYKRNAARLLSTSSTWNGVNGSMYEIDGIFEHLLNNDTTQLMYRTYLSNEPKFSRFKQILEKAGLEKTLDASRTVFTVFAPTNDAFESEGYTQDKVNQLSKEEAELLAGYHIARDVRVFTDGVVETITTLSGMRLTTTGSWDSFRLRTNRGVTGKIADENLMNLQVTNGVLHAIDNVMDAR